MEELASLAGNWGYPTSIRFGAGRIRELPVACRELGIGRPLLVTDPGLAALPMVADAVAACEEAGLGCAIFSDVQGNPVEANVLDGVAALRAGGHDGVIAFGGGSALDAGKAVALMVGQSRPMWDFEDREDWWSRVDEAGMVPVVAVPHHLRHRLGDRTRVRHHGHPWGPRQADHLPPRDDAGPGDPRPRAHRGAARPPHRGGRDGRPLPLPRSVLEPRVPPPRPGNRPRGHAPRPRGAPRRGRGRGADLPARARMQVAASMGSTAFQKGLGAMHSLSHPCGAVLDTHHGLTNAVVMPYVLDFNRPAIEDRMAAVARYLELPSPSFAAVLDWVLALRERIGIPHTLRDIGVDEPYARRLAPMAAEDPSSPTNPVPLDAPNLEALYLRAINGAL